MYGLIKIANEQEKGNALATAGNAALATGGAASLAASRDRLLGRKKLFYGTTVEDAAKIRRNADGFSNIVPIDSDQSVNANYKDARRRANVEGDPIVRSNNRNYERTSDLYYQKSDEAGKIYRQIEAEVEAANPQLSKKQKMMMEFEHPDATKGKALYEEANQLLNRLIEPFSNSEAARRQALNENPDLIQRNGEVLRFDVPFNDMTDGMPDRRMQKIDPGHIVGGDHDIGRMGRLKESLRLLPDYAKANPRRFATGAGLAGAGLAGMGLATHNQFDE